MTVDPAKIRTGLAANLATISGLRSDAAAPDSPLVPHAWPWADQPFMERETMANGYVRSHWVVTCLVAAGESNDGIRQLDAYLNTSGAKSLWAAIESDKKLGGAATDCWVHEIHRFDGNYIVAGNNYFAALVSITAIGTG